MEKQFGIIGLGLMGGNLARQAIEKGFEVVGLTKGDVPEDLKDKGIEIADDYAQLKEKLSPPRKVIVYVPAGEIVDYVLKDIQNNFEEGDIVIDGGNSYWGDSISREEKMKEKGIYFLDCGTSGGVEGARNGACFMIGGEKNAVEKVEPILKALAVPDGYVYTGPPGSGHYVKLVHNGIEFGMLQAIGEGMHLLSEFRHELDLSSILHCWNHGSVIRSWLTELMESEIRDKGSLDDVPDYIEDTGEVNWLVNDAMHMEIPIPVISQSVMQLFASRTDKKKWASAIAMMRHGFGGHPFGKDKHIKKERQKGRVGRYKKK